MSLARRKIALRRHVCGCCDAEIWVGERAFVTLGAAHVFCSEDCVRRGLEAVAKATAERYRAPVKEAA